MKIPINPTNRYMLGVIPTNDAETGEEIGELHVFPPADAHWEATGQQDGGMYVIKQRHFPARPAPKQVLVLESVTWIDITGPYDED